MEDEEIYTKDGTVDYRGKPANRKKTGTWKACPFILGTFNNPFLVLISGNVYTLGN
jgi:hypothetical protein